MRRGCERRRWFHERTYISRRETPAEDMPPDGAMGTMPAKLEPEVDSEYTDGEADAAPSDWVGV